VVGRFGMLITLAAALLLGCAGVVLAQQSAEEEFTALVSSLDAGDPIPDRYIVVLKDEVDQQGARGAGQARVDAVQVAGELAQETSVEEVTHVYQDALKGFAARIPAESSPTCAPIPASSSSPGTSWSRHRPRTCRPA
jgi:hypothetical protein